MRTGRILASAVASAALLALAGCASTAPLPAPASPDPSPSFTFPTVPGRVLSDTSVRGERHLRVRATDLEAAYADARNRLERAGFSLTKDRPAHDGGDGQACTTALCVSFTAVDDPQIGPSVTYEAFHSTGVVG